MSMRTDDPVKQHNEKQGESEFRKLVSELQAALDEAKKR